MKSGLDTEELTQNRKAKRRPVWTYRKPPYQVTKDGFTYRDIKTDYDGWVDPQMYRPEPFDLVFMKLDRKTISGWWTGNRWQGVRLVKGDKVLYWKSKESRKED